MSNSIVVLLNPIPDPAGLRIDHQVAKPVPSDQLVMSEFDANALEAAFQLREETNGEVIVLTVAPSHSRDVELRALAMGADRAIHLEVDNVAALNGLVVAEMATPHIRNLEPLIVLTGQQSTDWGSGSTGPAVAQYLGWPQVTSVIEISLEGGDVVAVRDIESGQQRVRVQPPVVLTAMTGLSEPRMPSLRGMMAAKKKPVETVEAEIPETDSGLVWGEPYVRQQQVSGEILQGVPADEAADRLVSWLSDNKLLPN